MLDSRIALALQTPDFSRNLENLGAAMQGRALRNAKIKMAQMNDPAQQQEFAKTSFFSPELTDVLKTQASEQLKAKQAAEDRTFELQKRGIDRQKAMNSAIAAALSGSPEATSFMLDHAKAGGTIDDDTYNQTKQFLVANANNPAAITSLVKGLGAMAADKPEQYLMPDANNVNTNMTSLTNNALDNQTSTDNNIRTVDASLQNNQLDNQTSLTNNQLNNYTSATNNQNTVSATMRGQDMSAETARQKSAYAAQTKGQETIAQRMERQVNAVKSAQASQAAATAAQKAADLVNHPGIDSGTGLTSAFGLIPNTDAKRFQTDLENLKAQLFLPTIQQMKGMGALSNAEGAKVEAAVQNLDPKIGGAEMRKRLAEVAKGMQRLAEVSRQEARIYASQGGIAPVQQPTSPNEVGIVSKADIMATAKSTGKNPEQIAQQLRAKGFTIK